MKGVRVVNAELVVDAGLVRIEVRSGDFGVPLEQDSAGLAFHIDRLALVALVANGTLVAAGGIRGGHVHGVETVISRVDKPLCTRSPDLNTTDEALNMPPSVWVVVSPDVTDIYLVVHDRGSADVFRRT